MNSTPFHNEPGFENGDREAVEQYNDKIRHETLRVAVCETVDPSCSTHQILPDQVPFYFYPPHIITFSFLLVQRLSQRTFLRLL